MNFREYRQRAPKWIGDALGALDATLKGLGVPRLARMAAKWWAKAKLGGLTKRR